MEEIHNENTGQEVSKICSKKEGIKHFIPFLITLFCVAIVVFITIGVVKIIVITEQRKQINNQDLISLNIQDSVMNHLFQIRVAHPYIAHAQAILESANFTSKLFKENHNHFGMKLAKVRPTTAIGVRNGYALYKSWQDCNIDYALWQASYARNLSEEEYYALLQRNYAEDSSYATKLKQIFK